MGRNQKYWRLRLTGYGMPNKDDDYYQVFMKNSCENFVFLVDHLQDVFEVKIETLQLDIGEEWNEEKMKPFANDNRLYELHGGFDITRADGRIATIGHYGYNLSHEDNPRQQLDTEECVRISRVWNLEQSDEEEEIEEEDDQGYIGWINRYKKEERRHIFMIVL
ncbi:hypothetical protein B9Z55_003673 [Caenorhabditis nigoni]|nr:hypothetical protein B9Z55_003673 [Caenorhabditis nigoni]